MAEQTLQQQAQEILEIAEANGVEQNFFFVTTFKRYQVQINILTDLERTIASPATPAGAKSDAISEYNRTSSAANATAGTLMKIISQLRPKDPLARAILRAGKEAKDD